MKARSIATSPFCAALFLTLAVGRPVPTNAGNHQFRIGLYTDAEGTDCHLASTPFVLYHTAYVVVTSSVVENITNENGDPVWDTFPADVIAFEFKAEAPPGVVWLGDVMGDFINYGAGNTQDGMNARFTASGKAGGLPYTIVAINYWIPSALPPTPWTVTGISDPEAFVIIQGVVVAYGKSYTAWIGNPSAYCPNYTYNAPFNPKPAYGQDNAPLNAKLGFDGDANRVWLSTQPFQTPRDEDIVCMTVGGGPCPNPVDPGILAPHTTYYWMAGNVCDPPSENCEDALGDLWTFTTGEGVVRAKTSTWGAIKALYR